MVRGKRCSNKKQTTKRNCKTSKRKTGIAFNQQFDLYKNIDMKPKLKIGKIEIDDTPDPKRETGHKIMDAAKLIASLAAVALAGHGLGYSKGKKEGEQKKWYLPYDEKFKPVDISINDKIDTLQQQLQFTPYLVNPFNIQEVMEDVKDKIKSVDLFKGQQFKYGIQDIANHYCNNFDKIMDGLKNGADVSKDLNAINLLLESARNGYNEISTKPNPKVVS